MKNIFLITRTDNYGYDEYDEVVVVAKTAKEAKELVLNGSYRGFTKDNIVIELIGVANESQTFGEVSASYNAG